MTDPRKPQGYRYLPLCLLLLSAGALAEVRDVRMHGPNGDGGNECTEADAADPADTATPAAKPAASAAKPTDATRIKPVVTVRGGDDGSVHAPRWHSFLPGMFR
jgi:hypothetical protein